jgi:hypothetical protein
VAGAIDLAEAIGALSSDVGQPILATVVRVKRMLRRLPR